MTMNISSSTFHRSMRLTFAVLVVIGANQAASQSISLQQIMADPDWIGRSPQQPYWADDSASIYFRQKREGSELIDLYRVSRNGNELERIAAENLGSVDAPGDTLSPNKRLKTYEREGDIFVKNLRNGEITQLTRSAARETNPIFSSDNHKVIFNRDNTVFVRNLGSGLEYQAADLRTEDPPSEQEDKDYLEEQQLRLFDIIKLQEQRERLAQEFADETQQLDASRIGLPWYLGADTEIVSTALSPNEKWLLAVTRNSEEREPGRVGSMPNYVTASGYVENQEVRSRVGTTDFADQQLFIFDLPAHRYAELDLSLLPTREEDPLGSQLQHGNDDKEEENDAEKDEEKSPREVQLTGIRWSADGNNLLFQAISRDNKDRWLLTLKTQGLELLRVAEKSDDSDSDNNNENDNDSLMSPLNLEHEHLSLIHHNHDPAWINRGFIAANWLPDNESGYFLSEADGFGHLYLFEDGNTEQLTHGKFEVSDAILTKNGRHIYFRGNVNHPGIHEIFRLNIASKELEQLTDLGGMNRFMLSPDESRLLIEHSDALSPPELYVKTTRPNSRITRLTQTISEEFSAVAWAEPEFVSVPSSNVADAIHSRVYTPVDDNTEARAAVIFIHGAGYLQNAHQGWSGYFREFMFHSLLVQQGYVVLDMDYRASRGYGRDWRTAIYQQMGTPEVQDLADGIDWLVAHKNVDRNRICTYGGSYGGFLTLMALFTEPDLFACGAALRPVTDWAHYNHGYTSNILNIPSLDPTAYAKSSPIEFAEGLNAPLLIAHGMQDDNVFFQDSVRLVQRLIELKKENWEMAIFPIEAHGFREPSSWLDEYRRIFNLFKENLGD